MSVIQGDTDEDQTEISIQVALNQDEADSDSDSILSPSHAEESKYIDPLDRISEKDESIYTIRRLNQVLNALDGFTLMYKQLHESTQMNPSDFNRLLQKMSEFDLIRQEDNLIKLHFHGSKVIRLLRDERKKTLARIAERMRKGQ